MRPFVGGWAGARFGVDALPRVQGMLLGVALGLPFETKVLTGLVT